MHSPENTPRRIGLPGGRVALENPVQNRTVVATSSLIITAVAAIAPTVGFEVVVGAAAAAAAVRLTVVLDLGVDVCNDVVEGGDGAGGGAAVGHGARRHVEGGADRVHGDDEGGRPHGGERVVARGVGDVEVLGVVLGRRLRGQTLGGIILKRKRLSKVEG